MDQKAAYQELELPEGVERGELDRRWVERVGHFTPGRPMTDLDAYERAMEAYLVITGEMADYPTPEGLTDWAPIFLRSQMWRGEDLRGEGPIGVEALGYMRDDLYALPDYLPGSRLERLEEFDVRAIIGRLLPLHEFRDAGLPTDPSAFRIVWRKSSWTKAKRLVMGSCATISKKGS